MRENGEDEQSPAAQVAGVSRSAGEEAWRLGGAELRGSLAAYLLWLDGPSED